MNCKYIFLPLLLLVPGLFGKSVENAEREKETVVSVENLENSRQGRAVNNNIYAQIITCFFRYDARCFVDVAQKYLDIKKKEILTQADQQVARASGSSDKDNKPSVLASSIEKLFSELAGLFRNGFSNFFSQDDDDDDLSKEKTKETEEDGDDEDDDKKGNSSRDVGANSSQVRKKKKKTHPIGRLIHKIILYVVVVTVLHFLLRFYYAFLAKKYWLINFGYFIGHAIKAWIWYKYNKYPIYYEHEHEHDHGHDEHEHWNIESSHGYDYEDHLGLPGHTHGSPNSYWGREDNAHSLAYSKQKPEGTS